MKHSSRRAGPSSIEFGQHLRATRRAHNLTQADVAATMRHHEHLNFSRATISQIENGNRTVTLDEAMLLALAATSRGAAS